MISSNQIYKFLICMRKRLQTEINIFSVFKKSRVQYYSPKKIINHVVTL